ncbi:M15 family metallopeptidase [Chryseolinea sp. H1M3-3]|uniref:M15 family metallopeptidase n=1 Tax=Chryseolinea sp. H1M3-3 TaxID=3034144 RepID=UPI0023ED7DB9|nr:M15 family metallopeptidase [Chryseolinea sp. H1M3-3]
MRLFLKVGLFLISSLLIKPANAQFNVNSLFAPVDFKISYHLLRAVTDQESSKDSLSVNTDELAYMASSDTSNSWKNWSFVENYAFGKNRGDLPMITDLNSLHPYFRDQVIELIKRCKAKGIELTVVEAYRTHAKQHEYKTMGKKYTSSGAGRSKHQYGLAVDVVPVVNGIAVWDNVLLWRKVGVIGEKLGLRWGGRWRKPYDPGHFEWTGGLTSSHLGSGKFPELPIFAERYPCLEEDILMLKDYWKEWETTQSVMTRK